MWPNYDNGGGATNITTAPDQYVDLSLPWPYCNHYAGDHTFIIWPEVKLSETELKAIEFVSSGVSVRDREVFIDWVEKEYQKEYQNQGV